MCCVSYERKRYKWITLSYNMKSRECITVILAFYSYGIFFTCFCYISSFSGRSAMNTKERWTPSNEWNWNFWSSWRKLSHKHLKCLKCLEMIPCRTHMFWGAREIDRWLQKREVFSKFLRLLFKLSQVSWTWKRKAFQKITTEDLCMRKVCAKWCPDC